MPIRKQIVEDIIVLAENGHCQQLGKMITSPESLAIEHLAACTRILIKANVESTKTNQGLSETSNYERAAITLIEALAQRKESENLCKLAFFSWNAVEKSPLSIRCLDQAIGLGPLDDIYDIGHRQLSSGNPLFVECAANLIIKLAEAQYRFAYFITGQIFLDGDGVKKNVDQARKWFHTAALEGSFRAVNELANVPAAYQELAKIAQNSQIRDFFLHQAEAVKRASADLSVNIPGEELESLVQIGESSSVEFKQDVDWGKTEALRDVAAFLNTNGGMILIGIDDKKQVVGITDCLISANVKNTDQYERHITQKLCSKFGAQYYELIKIDFPSLRQKEICRIRIYRSPKPIFVREENNDEVIWIRSGNSKRKLNQKEALEYCGTRFAK